MHLNIAIWDWKKQHQFKKIQISYLFSFRLWFIFYICKHLFVYVCVRECLRLVLFDIQRFGVCVYVFVTMLRYNLYPFFFQIFLVVVCWLMCSPNKISAPSQKREKRVQKRQKKETKEKKYLFWLKQRSHT